MKVIDARGNSVQLTYDAKGRLHSITDALSNTQSFVYDENNNLTQTLDALNRVVSQTQYDVRDNPTQVTDALNNSISLNYDPLSRVTEVQEPQQATTQFQYDALNRLIKSIDALQGESTQGFDADGNRDNFQDPNQHTTQFGFDESGRLIEERTAASSTGSDTGTTRYTYNARDLITQVTNGRNQNHDYSYDALGRITQIQTPEGNIDYSYDNNGNVLTVTDSSGTISRTYDALNRVKTYTDTHNNTLQYAYDEVGNLSTLTYPDTCPEPCRRDKQVQYGYDANNRLETVTDWANRVTRYTYDENGRLVETHRPNGTVQTRSYDAKGQLLQLKDVDAQAAVIVQYDFSYDAGGDIVEEKVTPTPQLFPLASTDMTYGAANRLATYNPSTSSGQALNSTGSGQGAQTAQFDDDGNLTFGPLDGAMANFSYDSKRRLTQAGSTTYQYDAENHRITLRDELLKITNTIREFHRYS